MTQRPADTSSTHEPELPPALMVETRDALDGLPELLRSSTRLAVDTEANSLHAYQGRVCLIQLSTDTQDILIDPLVFEPSDLDFLGEVFADPQIEKVFHAAEYDVMILRRDFGFEFSNLFDTMIAARVLGWERFGLGTILEERYGVRVDKSHQRADWGRRPLPPHLLRYARMDTHYLLDLRDELHADLAAANRLEEARELFQEVSQAEWNGSGFDPEGYWRINDARTLSPREMAVLRELYLLREKQAETRDVPVFKVMGDKSLVALAQAAPRSLKELRHVPGISEIQVKRFGVGILKAVKRGLDSAPPTLPRRSGPRPDDDVLRRYDALHTWRKERGLERGVASDVIISKDALWELAYKAPQTLEELAEIEALGPWRTEKYGDEILRVLAGENGDAD